LTGTVLGCGIVERVVDLVEKVGAVALVLANGGFAQGSVWVMLGLLEVVESYISGLLL
jgi:hypothetical protein